MPNRNFWNRHVLRVEYDHRVRETRLQLEHIERLLAKRESAEGFRYLKLLLLGLGNFAGSSRGRGRRMTSPDDRLPCQIGIPRPVPILVGQPVVYRSTIRAKSFEGMY